MAPSMNNCGALIARAGRARSFLTDAWSSSAESKERNSVVMTTTQSTNDVIVVRPGSGSGGRDPGKVPKPSIDDITIYGYPRYIFPPTSFHNAVYVKRLDSPNEFIYIIGGDAKIKTIHDGTTNVFRLDPSDCSITHVTTTGDVPASIHEDPPAQGMRSTHFQGHEIVLVKPRGDLVVLCPDTMVWRKELAHHLIRVVATRMMH
ncbi:hypothetical protein QBC34DRAFT_406507 [Podospora aff. communis PSN243]|uniref:Uncharacterized protein n=1 Tax=Podospora aff. communis PSN243 TaxID=3040156 RepID=A0AAV9GKE9_9PEZI|nr:hypothetical protein QBC34DRAFT_406507 [Podospora aff. communis PSN243]